MPQLQAAGQGAYRRLAVIGWIVYGLSWLTPNLNGTQFGAQAFLSSVTIGTQLLTHAPSSMRALAGVALLCGWSANFSLLFRWPVRARLAWIGVPWLPFVVLLINHGPAPSPITLLYFYPWAVGIALIHFAHALAAQRQGEQSGRVRLPTPNERLDRTEDRDTNQCH